MRPASEFRLVCLPIRTSLGRFAAWYSPRGLVRMEFPKPSGGRPVIARQPLPPKLRQWHRQTATALERVLRGDSPGALPPLDWSGATAFQRRVWRALLQMRRGQTCSYAELARRAGRAAAARAVGGACAANPIPVLVPCHRVLAAGGRLGGFSAGLDWKRRLLAREGVQIQ